MFERGHKNTLGNQSSIAGVLAGLAVAAICWSDRAAAATPAATTANQSSEDSLEEVVVTGSRIAPTGFTTPTPVTVIDRQAMDDLGIVNVGEALSQLPSDNAQVSATNTSVGSVNDYVSGANVGAQLANLRGLNPFFGTRTLTLVDGHRFVPSTNGGAVDLGLVPSNLVARTEVVTGGASAAYGSDAVAGVVNVVLDHNLQGVRAQTDFSRTAEGDGNDFHFGLGAGTALFGGRGHVLVGGEYEDSKAIGACTATRSWCKPYAIFDTPTALEATYPDYYFTDAARATVTPTGSIIATSSGASFTADTAYNPSPGVAASATVPASLRNLQFNDAGTAVVPWNTGQFIAPASRTMVGGDGLPQDFGTKLRVPVERRIGYGRFSLDLTDRVQGFIEGSFGQRLTSNDQVGLQYSIYGTSTSEALLKIDNAFLPTSVASLLTTAGRNGLFLNKANTVIPPVTTTADNKTYRGVIGFNGSFLETWKWDTYYTYGRNENEQSVRNARKDSRGATQGSQLYGLPRLSATPNSAGTGRTCSAAAAGTGAAAMTANEAATCGISQYTVSPFDFAIDAVVDNETLITPGTGSIVCRATLAPSATVRSLAQGCVPLNLLGTSNASAQALAYAFGTEYEHFDYTQNVLGFNTQGRPVDLWAGPLAVAAGVEFRSDQSNTTHDVPQYYFAPDFGGDFSGKTKIAEGYVESQLTLLKGLPLIESMDVDGAFRRTHNQSESGTASRSFDINTWKANLIWNVSDWLRLRGTRSRDVRAPSFRELFNPGRAVASFPVTNPWNPSVTDTADLLHFNGGNITLNPEVADTTTFGFVLQPKWNWAQGLKLSVDAYDITLKHGIANIGSTAPITSCFASHGTDPMCASITGVGDPVNGFTDIQSITVGSENSEAFRTRGVDIEIAYRLQLARFNEGLPGSLNFRFLSTWLHDLTLQGSQTGGTCGGSLQACVGTNYAGQVGSGGVDDTASFSEAPKWQANGTVGYELGGFRATLQTRFVGAARLYSDLIGPDDPRYASLVPLTANTDNSINKNRVGDYFTFNLSSSYEFTHTGVESLELFGVVRNLLDRHPAYAPPIPPGGGFTPTNPVYYDLIGRAFQVGLRVKL